MSIKIDVVNETTVLTAVEVAAAVAAVRSQLARDVEPVWGLSATARLVSRAGVHPGHWVLALLDNSDQANALGYHDTTANGLPLGKVFVRTSQQAGFNWTITLSHEVIEMVVDPEINLTVLDEAAGRAYAYEACDACEADKLGYQVNGVWVSDFVWPAFFELWRTTGAFDQGRHLSGPLNIAGGGYMAYFDLASGQWVQTTSRAGTSRGMRRRSGLRSFRASTAV